MSWINNSFNTLKGTISNLAQEVLAEHDQNDEYPSQQDDEIKQLEILEQSQKKIDELNRLCDNKDNQIALLRKQINDFQNKSIETGGSSQSPTNKNGNNFDDSWCWEPENNPTSESSSGGSEMINISLQPVTTSDVSKNDPAKDKIIHKLQNDNSTLARKVSQLEKQNEELNNNLDELDKQHNLAIENVLASKLTIQQNYQTISANFDNEHFANKEKDKKIQTLEKDFKNLTNKIENLQNAYTINVEENISLTTKLKQNSEHLKEHLSENVKLQTLLDEKEQQLIELIEKIENDFGNEREEENAELKKKLQLLSEHIEELENGSNGKKLLKKKNGDSSSTSSSGKQSEDEFIVLDDENQGSELIRSKHDEKIEELENTIADLETKIKFLETDNCSYLQKIEKLNTTKKIDADQFEELTVQNEKLKENFKGANKELQKNEAEQILLRKTLNEENLNLKNQISKLQKENEIQIFKLEEFSKSKTQESLRNLEFDKTKLENELKNSILKYEGFECDMKSLQLNLESKIADLENEVKILTKSGGNSPENMTTSIESIELEKVKTENDHFKSKINELTEGMKKCEANTSDVESKLMMENIDLHKKIIDLEASINPPMQETSHSQTSEMFVNFEELKNFFSVHVQTDLLTNDRESLEISFKTIRDRIWKIEVLEKNLKQMADEITALNTERAALKHKITTIKADNENYKIECEEVTKNNAVLLDELDNYYKKLQTIPENNEESLVILEKQLEDCNDLNKSLEEDYQETKIKIEDLQIERAELLTKVDNLEETITKLNSNVSQLNLQLDHMEIEKCNLIFEINEMKTDDKKSAIDSELTEHKLKITNLERQLERVSKDYGDLVASMQLQQSNLIESKKECERLEKSLREKDKQITERTDEIENYKQEFEVLQSNLIEKSSTEDDKQNLVTTVDQLKSEKIAIEIKLKEFLKENENTMENFRKLEENYKQLQENNESLVKKSIESELSVEESLKLAQKMETLNLGNQELLQTVQTKHDENLKYYGEIQRLGQVLQNLQQENEKLHENLLEKTNENCLNCKKLTNDLQINSKQMEKFEDNINFLKEKSDILTKNLLAEQTNQKLLLQDKIELSEKNGNLLKDLERLRKHLVNIEESHTQETLDMQNVIDETKAKMIAMEESVSKSSTAYTSASIRANQHAETIQAQYSLVTQQRDELATKLSNAEDRELKNQAALVNLQCALEQFQRGKEKEIENTIQRIRKELQYEKDKQNALQIEIISLKEQLADANQGLLAASRISDQLESSKVVIIGLKEDIEKLEIISQQLEKKLKATESSQEDKIDKNLVKSLIIGYVVSNSQNDKFQVLKVISSVLDFNQNEIDKSGLNNKNQTGWFGGVLSAGAHNKDSLAEAFVNFLEKESQPRPAAMPNLLNIVSDIDNADNAHQSIDRSGRKISVTNYSGHHYSSPTAVQPVLLNENILAEHYVPSRNTSSILKDILNDS